ncbi:uncharacterized protein BXZ73DRAFT_83041 [Epithele typhae]|uniref:uncharacterized protein n=1 Tax=Epithele typhae TaxID=378194 RepID=UPI0020077E4C|nr:uncharacterized protein BXZ73DRAFT_83041 [Epithele typhae]KAH9911002.1 hypothetical protein BXZ73DRAFT_83041 [Epithele typhae]
MTASLGDSLIDLKLTGPVLSSFSALIFPLLSLPRVAAFRCLLVGLRVTFGDVDLEAIARAWPGLTQLDVRDCLAGMAPIPAEPAPTWAAVTHLLETCVKLQTLRVPHLDVSHADEPSKAFPLVRTFEASDLVTNRNVGSQGGGIVSGAGSGGRGGRHAGDAERVMSDSPFRDAAGLFHPPGAPTNTPEVEDSAPSWRGTFHATTGVHRGLLREIERLLLTKQRHA